MLINADAFTGIIQSYRLLWISGRFGGGKTSLAYKLAQPFLENGYRLISNNQSVWADDLEDVKLDENGKLKAVIILDEGGQEFKASRQVEQIAAYARKMDTIYILPSFWAPTRAAQVMVCQPLFNFKSTGIPLIIYKWRVKLASFEDKGYFAWWNPREVYGIYSTNDPGDRASEIIAWLVKRTAEYRGRYGYKSEFGLQEVEITEGDKFLEAGESIEDASEAISVSFRKSRRR